jgi:hypothetical protein
MPTCVGQCEIKGAQLERRREARNSSSGDIDEPSEVAQGCGWDGVGATDCSSHVSPRTVKDEQNLQGSVAVRVCIRGWQRRGKGETEGLG